MSGAESFQLKDCQYFLQFNPVAALNDRSKQTLENKFGYES
jgi:hypothetical protein